jgi:hypothetical protein
VLPERGVLRDAAVREGHRHLLSAFRAFGDTCSGVADAECASAVLAFLRESVLPFARWEEAGLEPGSEEQGGVAFEHAFLAVESERLAAALERGNSEEVRRRLHRIEAVLELHVERTQDRCAETSAYPDPG